jgi:hypothetical protein
MQHLSSLTALAIFAAVAAVGVAQDPVPAKQDPEIKVKLKEYEKLVKDRKGSNDDQATRILDELLKKFEKMHPKDQADFAKGIAVTLTSSRVKREATADRIYRATIQALGQTGEHGSKYLAGAFKNKSKFKGNEWINLRGEMLEQLGRTKDEDQIKFLLDVALRDPNDTLMAKAGGALKHFEGLKLTGRKEIAKPLIKKFTEIQDMANRNLAQGDAVTKAWRDRLTAVSDPWNTTLQKLTKQHLRSASEWNRFLNKHWNQDWDKPLKATR